MIDALITGRSLPALQSALDLAEVGLKVALAMPPAVEAAQPLLAAVERDPEGVVAELLRRLAQPVDGTEGVSEQHVLPAITHPKPPLLRGPKGGWLPQTSPEVLGIPAVPLSAETIALIGNGGAFRAYLDRIIPLLTVGKTKEFGRLVRSRMGRSLLQKLVEPQVVERFGVGTDRVDTAVAAPGLNEALSRAGALSSGVLAYSERNVARETRVAPSGSDSELLAAILHKLSLYDVRLLDSTVVDAEDGIDGWSVLLSDGKQIESRALISDQGRDPLPKQVTASVVGPLAVRYRNVAQLTVERTDRPEWLAEDESAVTAQDGFGVRLESREDGTVLVLLSSLAAAVPDQGEGEIVTGTELETDHVREILVACGMSPAPAPGTEFHQYLVAAPFASTAERDRAHKVLRNITVAQDTLLPVGRALYGDDLGAACAAAHKGAVALRRRLLGFDDGRK